ncbi:alkaline phosphatase, tissue-nonspecific isozyme [Neolamprologus brichardi]|uniref:alkaline phosphatase, tissue-nonspecific isozyme n=1 Tax=Neolamprologus brichardi TaxID=32507 RepID=UPI001643D872|nr:alkaline phosphatase, tissue-nonspecific isozyme [Neolamprologus brichardi]
MESTRRSFLALFLLVVLGSSIATVEEENSEFWRSQARKTLQAALDRKLNTNVAKNILFFLGDGMGLTTLTAARILKGQLEKQPGEETVMTMDTFPNVCTVQTYSVDFQVADSAATATAYLCGVKTNLNIVGVNAAGRNGVCRTQKGNEVTSILKWAKDAGKSVGIVTTTRVQHATPAGSYAHSASRTWYSDADMPDSAKTDGCTDISFQLINNTDIDVIIGGGRKYMTPTGTKDPEYPTDYFSNGKRKDGRDLIKEWQNLKTGKVAHYVWNKADFDAVDPETTDYLMGMFFSSFAPSFAPSCIPLLLKSYQKAVHHSPSCLTPSFLVFTGGRIDQAHHAGRASMALHEAVAFDRAIAKGLELTQEHETLTVVMADHSQPLTFNGFPFRGNSILGKSPLWASDMLPYTTLMYGNGPGHKIVNGTRPDIRNVDTKSKDYIQQAAVPVDTTTHSGEDVAVLARGPMAHLFQGVNEQNYIAHAMGYAACVGADLRHCEGQTTPPLVHITLEYNKNGAGAVSASAALLGNFLSVLLAITVLM